MKFFQKGQDWEPSALREAMILLALATAVSFALSSSSLFEDSFSGPTQAQADTPAGWEMQVRADLAEVAEVRERSQTHEEWLSSGYTPKDVLSHVEAMASKASRQEVRRVACSALANFPDHELVLFEGALLSQEISGGLPCREKLLNKIARVWQGAEARLGRLFPQDRTPRGTLPTASIAVPSGAPVYFGGALGPKRISITFDDGPHLGADPRSSRTLRIMEILNSFGVSANFFQTGRKIQAATEIPQTLERNGHVLGHKTWSDVQLTRLPVESALNEIDAGREALVRATGQAGLFFRFPFGARTEFLQDYVKSKGMATFFWNLDSLDWKTSEPQELLAHLIELVKGRDFSGILLFHDDLEQTVMVLPYFLKWLEENGVTVVVFR